MSSKAQQKREAAYRAQLRKCGFRSWKQANARRAELIEWKVYRPHIFDTSDGQYELPQLQKLADLYRNWKTNNELGRMNRRLERQLRKLNRD